MEKKPITILASELHDEIMKLLNESELHPIILEVITRDIHSEISSYLRTLKKQEEQMYNQQLQIDNVIDNDIEE